MLFVAAREGYESASTLTKNVNVCQIFYAHDGMLCITGISYACTLCMYIFYSGFGIALLAAQELVEAQTR